MTATEINLSMPTGAYVELPDEWFLRDLLEIDPFSPSAIAGIVGKYGAIYPPDHAAHRPQEAWALLPESEKAQTLHLGVASGPEASDYRQAWKLAGYYLHAAQTVVRHWAAHLASEDVRQPWADAFGSQLSAISERKAWSWWASHVNAAIDPIRPGVFVTIEDRRVIDMIGADEDARFGFVYTASLAQLFNHVAEGAIWRRCRSATCQRLFYRQQGTAVAGQFRTEGVDYCTRSCAKAEANRRYRQSKKSARPVE